MRDDFTKVVKEKLAKRVGYICSNPDCQLFTVGAGEAPSGVLVIGVAAHICAASPGGPRYDANMVSEERASIDNGIWLCQNCAHLIDTDTRTYTVEVLKGWKQAAERKAHERISSATIAHMGDVFQYGVSLNEMESRLKASTQPNAIDLDFFNYGIIDVDENIADNLRTQNTLNVKFSSKEEGLYYILHIIKNYLPEMVNKVLIVETEINWRKIVKIAKDLILIPMFAADRIDRILGNKMVFIYTAEDSCDKVQSIEVPNRTMSNLYYKLSEYFHDPVKAHLLIEKTSGVYAALMRQLTCNCCVNNPAWRKKDITVLIPAALLGTWTTKEGDKELITRLAETPYDEYADKIRKFLEKEDPFLVRYESDSCIVYKVTDPLEAIECFKSQLNKTTLNNFGESLLDVFVTPHSCLNEIGIISETGKYSTKLKKGIAKTLIVMSLSDYAYGDGNGENYRAFVNRVVKELMERLHTKPEWEAVCEFLPFLIEAAPSAVLDKIEKCVTENDEAFWSLFEPVQKGFFINSMYVHILDALSLALLLDGVPVRALQVLESIAEKNIDYKLGNTPVCVLAETFSPALPVVDMSLERKEELINSYAEMYPRSCWFVLKDILAADFKAVGMSSNKPLYHLPKTFSQKITYKDVFDTLRKYYLIAFRCAGKDLTKWADFFDSGYFIAYGFRDTVVSKAGNLVSGINITDEDKYKFEKATRRFLHNQRFLGVNSNYKEEDLSYIEHNLLNRIQYHDSLYNILYAFDGRGLDISPYTLDEEMADKIEGHTNNHNKVCDEQKRILRENFVTGNYKLNDLILKVEDSYDLGEHICEICHMNKLKQDFAYSLYRQGKPEALRGYLYSALGSLDNEAFFNRFEEINEDSIEMDYKFRFLTSRTIDENFLLRLQSLQPELQDYFWTNVRNPWIAEQNAGIIEKYVKYTMAKGNCQDALNLTYLYDFNIETYIRILEAVLRFDIRIDSYQAQQIFEKIYAFEHIDDTLKIRILHLEESYAVIFTNEHKPKYLLAYLRSDPLLSVNILSTIYRKEHDKSENTAESENGISDFVTAGEMEREKTITEKNFHIYFNIHFCPCEKAGTIDCQELDSWCTTYLEAIRERDIATAGKFYLGRILSHCPVVADGGVWPLPAVCKVIEKYYSQELQKGFVIAVLNSRGVYSFNGGKGENSLAQKYEKYAKQLEVTYPKTATIMRFIGDVYNGEAKIQRSRAEYEYC